jgi:uncharacterized membrane protein YgaE (UPF0421/DUF939 family)
MELEPVHRRLAAAPRVALSRVRPSLPRLAEAAVAAAIAWLLARLIPGHASPVFAPIATLIALTAGPGQRGRQAAQLLVGILIGIVLSDIFVVAFGRGTWQLALIVLIGTVLTTAVGLPSFMVAQVAIWGVIVLSLHGGYLAAAGRFVDGLIGAGIALVFSQLLFPVDPLELVESQARPVYQHVAGVLWKLAKALEAGDEDAARGALDATERLDDRGLREALQTAREVVRRAPRRRARRERLDAWAEVVGRLDETERHLTVLATRILRGVGDGEPPPEDVHASLREAAELYEQLPDEPAPERAESALDALREAADGGLLAGRTRNA